MGRIQTTVLVQSLSNFTSKLWMMRGGTLLILGLRVKCQGQLWHSMYKTMWTRYRLLFESNLFQTSHVSCWSWEEGPYWFWVTGSKVKVNFGTLCIRPCGHNTDHSLSWITFKLHMSLLDDMGGNPIDFGSQGQRSSSILPTCEGTPCFALASFCSINKNWYPRK